MRVYACTGGRDGTEERRNGGDRVGGEHPVLVDRIQRGRVESGARRPGLATAAESSILPARIYVHHVLRQHRFRALESVTVARIIAMLRLFASASYDHHFLKSSISLNNEK